MIRTRRSFINSLGFSIVELLVAFAILGVGVAVYSNMRSQHFKSVGVIKNRQEATRVGHFLLTFTDCAKTKAVAGYAAACAAGGKIGLVASDNTEILPSSGKMFDNLTVSANCKEGLITVNATGPDWSSVPKPLLDGVPIVCKDAIVPCAINTGYNPSQIDCTVNVKGNTIWKRVDGWKQLVNGFSDAQASFISPLSTASTASWGSYCPEVPGSEKLLYTTYIDIQAAGNYSVESIIDDTGSVRFWENGDPSKEIVVAGNRGSATTVNLKQKKYVIVIDATDTGRAATGAVYSIRDPAGKVIKRSESNNKNETCIFRVTASENIKTYIPKAASCRQCYGNLAPP